MASVRLYDRSFLWALGFALLAFAGNSLLCRAALKGELIDAGSFTLIRVVSAALTLAVVVYIRGLKLRAARIKKRPVIALSLYLVCFSYGYIYIDAGVGALLLFGVVQLVMMFVAVSQGEHLSNSQKVGVVLACIGLVWLLWPQSDVRLSWDIGAILSMVIAGIGWAVYTLCGRDHDNHVTASYENFLYAIPLCVLMCVPLIQAAIWSYQGVVLAIISGSLTSAMGYVVWYRILPLMPTSHAAIWQLLVPVIATVMGAVVLGEWLTLEAIMAMIMVLSGVLLMISRSR